MKKVAILGKLPGKFKAPFYSEEYEIWGCNVHKDMDKIPRYDRWFDVHDSPSRYPFKIVTRDELPIIKLIELVGGKFFNNSISYMIAYAIYLGFDVIALYGVKLNNGEEIRTLQRQNVRELLFFAMGRGIKITVEPESELLIEYPLYK